MSSNIQLLNTAIPNLSKTDLFNIALLYNRQDDIHYLLKNHRAEINVMGADNGNFLLDCIERSKNVNMLIFILMYGAGKLNGNNPRFSYSGLAKKFPSIIPYLVARLKMENKVSKDTISEFVEIALSRNSANCMKPLLEFKEYMNEYRYTLLLCGAGTVKDIEERMAIVNEIADECIETANLCENFLVLEYIRGNVSNANPFIDQKIRDDMSIHTMRQKITGN